MFVKAGLFNICYPMEYFSVLHPINNMAVKTTTTAVPAVLGPSKKKPLKEKRKRKKSADKDNRDMKIDVHRSPVPTKIYSTLPLYDEIMHDHDLEDTDFYAEFNRYVLTPEQLMDNSFPLECPETPGRIILRPSREKPDPDPTARTCSRCFLTYHVDNDVYRPADTSCTYHPGRLRGTGHYSCCLKDHTSSGCRWFEYHVSSALPLADLVFRRVGQGKRQVREDQSRKVYALDCEMVFTTIGMEVTKVGLVDLEGKTVYQTFVLPEHPVLDYNTEFSGITKNDLKGVDITLADVQSFLLRTLNKDTILVGHALQNDLRVLRIVHERVVDTQVVFHLGTYRQKLKSLALEFLQRTIQDKPSGHDSIEDARACMELMLYKIKSDMDKRPPSWNKRPVLSPPSPAVANNRTRVAAAPTPSPRGSIPSSTHHQYSTRHYQYSTHQYEPVPFVMGWTGLGMNLVHMENIADNRLEKNSLNRQVGMSY